MKILRNQQLIYLAVLTFGIQFANSLQTANMSNIYRFLGASSDALPYLGLAGPIAGLVIQPIIGQLSDETFTRYGRRRPYIFGWSLAAIFCCILLPFSKSLWMAATLMWILSCSINGTVEALRALTGDIVPNEQKATAFSWQTILAGIGAGIAATLPFLFSYLSKTDTSFAHLFKSTFAAYTIPPAIKFSFMIGGVIWLATMYWTLTRVREHLPEHEKLYQHQKEKLHHSYWQNLSILTRKMIKNIQQMPPVMKQFGFIQIFTWIGLYAMWLYFSIAISQHLFGVPSEPGLESDPKYAQLLEAGALKSNFYFSIYQYVSFGYAMFLPFLVKYFTPRKIHGVSLMIGALGLAAINFTHSNLLILGCMIAVGIMWGSIMTLPYAIVSAELPYNKMGIYLGIFNISITLPQIIGGLILQPIYAYLFQHRAIDVMMMSGVLIFIGGLLTVLQKATSHRHPIKSAT